MRGEQKRAFRQETSPGRKKYKKVGKCGCGHPIPKMGNQSKGKKSWASRQKSVRCTGPKEACCVGVAREGGYNMRSGGVGGNRGVRLRGGGDGDGGGRLGRGERGG